MNSLPSTVAGLEHVEVVQGVHAGEPAEKPYGHEQADLDPGDRHTDRAGRRGVPTHGVDPVSDLGPGEDPLRQHDEDDPPENGDVQLDRADLEGVREDEVERRIAVHRIDVR